MVYEIVETLIPFLESLSFADVVMGIVKPLKVSTEAGVKTYPVAYNTPADACLTGDYIDLLPNTSNRCVMYFEDKGAQFRSAGKDFEFVAFVNLICWFNYKLIDKDLHSDTLLVANVLNVIPEHLSNLDYLNRITIIPIRQLTKDPSVVFGAYSYNEAEVQYVTYPYDFFGIEYEIRFTITKSCVPSVSLDTGCL